MNLLENYIDINNTYYIYGTTSFGMYCYKAIVDLLGEDHVEAFVESNPNINVWRGKPVISPDKIPHQKDNIRIIIASITYCEIMKENLSVLKIPDWKVLVLNKLMPYFQTLHSQNEVIESICLWPPVTDNKGFLAEKVSWFAPDRIKIFVFGETRDFSGRNIVKVQEDHKSNIFSEVDKIFIWKTAALESGLRKFMDKIHIIDPDFFLYVETLNYDKLYYLSFVQDQRLAMERKSKEIFKQMREISRAYNMANIFCSGPSIQEAYAGNYEGCFNIICNSMVKDRQFMSLLKPKAIMFTDVNYYFSPTAYCRQFLKDLKVVQREYDLFVIVYEYEVALLLYHCPELKGRVIGISNSARSYGFPDENALQVRASANIMTETMLPVASALFDEIGIFGCTGRCPDENFYWQHNPNTQYHDLMQSIFDMYPSLFRDQGYADYYDRHCNIVKELIAYGQSVGKKYVNYTTSFIPALIEISSEIKNTGH